MSPIPLNPATLLVGLLVVLAAGLLLALVWRRRLLHLREEGHRLETALRAEGEARHRLEETLRRTRAMFQMLQDITAAAGMARTMEEAFQSTLDLICSYTGWPVAHVLLPEPAGEAPARIRPSQIWHLENPHEYEGFLRSGEPKALALGKGAPGRAWSTRRAVWTRYTEVPNAAHSFHRAVDVGLACGFAIPVFHDEQLLGVLEFFSPPVPDPDEIMLQALDGVGHHLGRIAERLEAEAALDDLNRKLIDLNEEKSQLLAIASHDLKNPMNTIGLSGRMLAEETLDEDMVRSLGRRIADEARRTTQLIQKLLDVTAIESGRFNLHLGETSLAEVLLQARASFDEAAEAKGQAIALDLGPGDVLVQADPVYLQEVVDNLVSNALKFMPPGPPRRTVHLAIRPGLRGGVLEVRDEGPGFSAQDLQKAFGRYSKLTARPTAGESSSGLGLFIVKKLVEAMGGSVELESQPGRGTLFRLILPAAPEPRTDAVL